MLMSAGPSIIVNSKRLSSGAHFISTDFPFPGDETRYGVTILVACHRDVTLTAPWTACPRISKTRRSSVPEPSDRS